MKNWYNEDGIRVKQNGDGLITEIRYTGSSILYTMDINSKDDYYPNSYILPTLYFLSP
jgi:hypothetical protein